MRTDDGDTEFINISGEFYKVVHLLLFLIYLDYVFKKALDRNNDIGFILIEKRSKRYPAIQITYVYYADDLAIANYI